MGSFTAVVAGNPTLATDINQLINGLNGAATVDVGGALGSAGVSHLHGTIDLLDNGTAGNRQLFEGTTDPATIGGITVNAGDIWFNG